MIDLLATYVHDFDPVIFSISEKIKLRWYGLSYVMGFAAAYLILLRLSRKKLWPIAELKVGDVVTYTAIFGVFLGGRIGYVLFYMLPSPGGLERILEDPITIIAVWEGGMASHGGILGIMLFTLFYAWKKQRTLWPAVGDGFAIVAPLGIFFGRMANFINGELYGTVTDEKNWWAVKFPKSLYESGYSDQLQKGLQQAAVNNDAAGEFLKDRIRLVGDYDGYDLSQQAFEQEFLPIARENPDVMQALADHAPARHPSQLYEGILEGLLVFLILYVIRLKFPKLRHGILTGIFFVAYALFRILVENVREPDAEMVGEMTKGQFLSIFMVAIGVSFIASAFILIPRRFWTGIGGVVLGAVTFSFGGTSTLEFTGGFLALAGGLLTFSGFMLGQPYWRFLPGSLVSNYSQEPGKSRKAFDIYRQISDKKAQ
ncbi:MAG: prolipoprotein diacylglyceryl transferase [Akkermansiaceae bacterium]|nr:prolipoprotein diacylglyceryl transferase [Akkermansiaceae bacterium]